MSKPDAQDPLELAFQAALAARPETFLARYPRKLKLVVLFLLLGGAAFSVWKEIATHAELSAAPVVQAEEKPSLPEQSETPAPSKAAVGAICDEPTASPPHYEPKTEAEKNAMALNDDDAQATRQMEAAPDPTVSEKTTDGILPRVSEEGRNPWLVYARPFDKMDPRPKISLIITDMGLSRVATDAALRRLPPDVTLAFDAQSASVEPWLTRARQDGHETILSLPMEPLDFPRSDPGPGTLLTSLPNPDNLERYLSFLKRGTGYVGVTTLTGSRFIADSEKLKPIMEDIRTRGLLVLDTRIASQGVLYELARKLKVPVAVASQIVDRDPQPRAIDESLAVLEQIAQREGKAIAKASPLPVTLERIEVWAAGLKDRGIVLAPVSAVVE